jgi:hypothetical protein
MPLADWFDPNYLVFPFAFVWRHYLELALKDIIIAGCESSGEDVKFLSNKHEIMKLWRQARPHIVECGPEDDPVLVNVESCLKQFEDIDPWAVGFRYPVKKDLTTASLKNAPPVVNIQGLHEAMLELASFFTCVREEQQRRADYSGE